MPPLLFKLPFLLPLIMTRKILDTNIIPENYSVLIDTHTSEFHGSVSIRTRISHPTSVLKLNVHKLTIAQVEIVHDQNTIGNSDIELSESDQVLSINLRQKVSGIVYINISYGGKITNCMNGYYVSEYKSEGKVERLYSTHFEPTRARSAVPCFDQPDMKATFDVVLTVPDGLVGLSNMDVKYEDSISNFLSHTSDKNRLNKMQTSVLENSPNKSILFFNTSPKMSTYLLAFVIGNIAKLETTLDNIKIGVYAPAGEEKDGDYALEVTKQCLDYYQTYFQIKYPLPKLDNIAIPNFAMGAMENWGLVTYRKSSLLYGSNSSLHTKKRIAETVCHELAHQWFGNLVTMTWWNDLWLNEGFATWASYKAVEHLESEFPATDFIASETTYGMSYDALNSTHPISVEVNDPKEIDQIFDGISYSKGACLINMLEDYLGKDFQTGLISYLKKNEYGNAETQDLWDSLKVEKLMNDWVMREGVPIVSVEERDDFLVFKQKRFLYVEDYKTISLSNKNNDKSDDKKSDDKKSDDKKSDDKNTKSRNANLNSLNANSNSLDSKSDSLDNNSNSLDNNSKDKSFNVKDSLSEKNNSGTTDEKVKTAESQHETNPSKDHSEGERISPGKRSSDDSTNDKSKVFKPSSEVWKIPVRISFYGEGTELNELYMFEAEEMKVKKKSDIYKLNNESAGFYVTNYENTGLTKKLLEKVKLGEKDKLGLLNDTFNLVKASMLPVKDALELLPFYKDDTNCDIVSTIIFELTDIKSIFYKDKKQRDHLKASLMDLISSKIELALQNIKGDGLKYNELSLYTSILSTAVGNGHEATIKRLGHIFEEYKKNKTAIHPNFRGAMFVSLMKRYNAGEEALFDELFNLYTEEKSDDVKNGMLLALGSSNNFDFLATQLLGDEIKTQDKMYLFASLSSNSKTRDKTIALTMKNFDKIQQIFEDNSNLLAFTIERVFGIISHREMRDEVVKFLQSVDVNEVDRSARKCLEKSEIRIRFRDANLKEFE